MKETIIMQDNIKTTFNNIKESAFFKGTCTICKTGWNVASVIAPAVLSAYLLLNVADKVVTVLAAASAAVSLVNLVRISHRAASVTTKKATKKTSK